MIPAEPPITRFGAVAGSLRETLLGLVYPPVCALCRGHRACAASGYVCEACDQRVRRIGTPCCPRCGVPFTGVVPAAPGPCADCRAGRFSWDRARAAVEAEGIALECIHRLKYGNEPWFATFLSGLLLEAALPDLAGRPVRGIVPVPLHAVRLRERGFNQAERLARPLAIALGVPLVTDLVQRREPTVSQASLSREERMHNVRSAFGPSRTDPITGSWIVVDDVLTTGATTDAVCRVLRSLGADEVSVWAVARATLDP
ncbi:MAG: hypothetical protein RIT19_2317 [Verrucomicrobiota bacterium]|jgi:ComF family protein